MPVPPDDDRKIHGFYGVDRWFENEEEENQYKAQKFWYQDIDSKLEERNPATDRFIYICSKVGSGGGHGHPPYGEILESYCEGTTKVIVYADGNGGSYSERKEKSLDCGFDPASEYPTGPIYMPTFHFTSIVRTNYYITGFSDNKKDGWIYNVAISAENIQHLSTVSIQSAGISKTFGPTLNNHSTSGYSGAVGPSWMPVYNEDKASWNVITIKPADPRLEAYTVLFKLTVGFVHTYEMKL